MTPCHLSLPTKNNHAFLQLRVLAKLAKLPYLSRGLKHAIVRRTNAVTVTDEETALREALKPS